MYITGKTGMFNLKIDQKAPGYVLSCTLYCTSFGHTSSVGKENIPDLPLMCLIWFYLACSQRKHTCSTSNVPHLVIPSNL